jgi:hypothetical protein
MTKGDGMDVNGALEILKECQFRDWDIIVQKRDSMMYLQVMFLADRGDGIIENQTGRKWFLSEHMTRSEVVQTAFKAVMTALEHEAREHFKYRGSAIFGPHFDVDVLVDVVESESFDVRKARA